MQELKEAVVLFGGSFDPVQNAHVSIAEHLTERFYKTVIVPGFISPFKKDGASADAALRLKMLKAALKESDKLMISEYEINKGGVSYTFETAKHFAKEFKGRPLYFALGSEMIPKLHKWQGFDELKSLVTFYVIGRPGFFIKDQAVRKLLKNGAKLVFADFTGLSDSSAKARLDTAFGKFESVPKAVSKIIKQEKLYSDFMPIVAAYPEFSLSAERTEHIYYTAATAIDLAKLYNVNVRDAVTAALLHDITKEADAEFLKSFDIAVPDGYPDMPKKVVHAFTGAEAVKKYFKIRKKSIADAVRFHTTGAPKMSKLAKIIFLADYIEPTRDRELKGLDEVRELAKTNLNAALTAVLEAAAIRLEKKGGEVYYLTADALEFYQNAGKKKTLKEAATVNNAETVKVKAAPPAPAPDAKSKKPAKAVSETDADGTWLAHFIAACLDEKKGRDITLIDLKNKTIIADYFVIVSVTSTTAVRALTDYVDEKLSKGYGIEPLRRDLDSKWAAIDYNSVILHIQTEESRKFYNIERLWSDGTNVTRYGTGR